jgi:hypothetical protein
MLLDELGDGGGIGHPWSLIVKDEGSLVELVDRYDWCDMGHGLGEKRAFWRIWFLFEATHTLAWKAFAGVNFLALDIVPMWGYFCC